MLEGCGRIPLGADVRNLVWGGGKLSQQKRGRREEKTGP
jgi:hypothetical protein